MPVFKKKPRLVRVRITVFVNTRETLVIKYKVVCKKLQFSSAERLRVDDMMIDDDQTMTMVVVVVMVLIIVSGATYA